MKKSEEMSLARIRVNNLDADHLRYVVARMNGKSELWYWGSWDDYDEAQRVAEVVGGLVIDMID